VDVRFRIREIVDSGRVIPGASDIPMGGLQQGFNGGHLILMAGREGNEVQWFCGHARRAAEVTVPVPGYEKYTKRSRKRA